MENSGLDQINGAVHHTTNKAQDATPITLSLPEGVFLLAGDTSRWSFHNRERPSASFL